MNHEFTLGLSYGYHDSAAAILQNGEIVSAMQEERLTRVKGDSRFPINAIQEVLVLAQLNLSDISSVVFYEKPMLKFERILRDVGGNYPASFDFFKSSMTEWLGKSKLDFLNYSIKQIADPTLRKEFNDLISRVGFKFSHHHLSHASSAFFPSGFNEAAVIVADAVGEYSSTSVWAGQGSDLRLLKEYQIPDSIGVFYSIMTCYLGFKANSGEYKVMGLAPFGSPKYVNELSEIFTWSTSDSSFPDTKMNLKVVNPVWTEKRNLRSLEKYLGHPRRERESLIEEYYANLASSLQRLTDDYMVALSAAAKKITGSANLVLAGGVALNCVSNEKIRVASGFDKVWIQPAAGDAGGAIGAGLAYQSKLPSFNSRRAQTHTYLGSLYSSDAIKSELERFEIQSSEKPLSQVYSLAVTNLIEEKIIGWFHGRSEFGPRALGNRSILGRPDSTSMQKRMNLKIKFRESFRPFAPVIMEEYFHEFFEGEPDPYMIRVARVKDFKPKMSSEFDISSMLETPRSVLQATTHLDGSARVQTVSASSNPRIHGLLDGFREATGLPVLINTSFNTRGEPIVNSPRDALLAFARTEIDVLCLENFVLFREDISNKLKQEAGKVEFDAD